MAELGPLATKPRVRRARPASSPAWEKDKGSFMGEASEVPPELQDEIVDVMSAPDETETSPPPDVPGPLLDGEPDDLGYTDKLSKRAQKAEQTILGWETMAQMYLMTQGDIPCAVAIGVVGKEIAHNAARVCDDFPWLLKGVEAGDKWTGVFALSLSVARLGLMIGIHHDVIPYNDITKMLVPPQFANTKDASDARPGENRTNPVG